MGDCTKNTGSTTNEEKPGTPAGMQLERAVKGYFPANTSSFDFLIASGAHGFQIRTCHIRNPECRVRSSGGAAAYNVTRSDLGRIISVSLTKRW